MAKRKAVTQDELCDFIDAANKANQAIEMTCRRGFIAQQQVCLVYCISKEEQMSKLKGHKSDGTRATPEHARLLRGAWCEFYRTPLTVPVINCSDVWVCAISNAEPYRPKCYEMHDVTKDIMNAIGEKEYLDRGDVEKIEGIIKNHSEKQNINVTYGEDFTINMAQFKELLHKTKQARAKYLEVRPSGYSTPSPQGGGFSPRTVAHS